MTEPELADARSDLIKLRDKLEDAQYDLARRNEDCTRVREELVPLLHKHPLADETIARAAVRAGYVAKVAADVLRYQNAEIERLTARRQAELDELKAKCGQQADMLAKHCQRRVDIERMVNSFDPTSGADRANAFKGDLLHLLGGAR